MPSILAEKEGASISPTKTSLTRYSPLGTLPPAQGFSKSVEFRRSLSKEGVLGEIRQKEEIL